MAKNKLLCLDEVFFIILNNNVYKYKHFVYIIIMNLTKGQLLKLKGKFTDNKVFKIIGFTPKRVHVYNIDLGTEFSWYIKTNQIVKIIK